MVPAGLDGFVKARIEGHAHRCNALDADLAERVPELLQDHAHTVGDRLCVARLAGMQKGALEVVEYRQKLAQELFFAALVGVVDLATGALPEIVEVGGGTQELVTDAGDFRLRLFERRGGRAALVVGCPLLGGGRFATDLVGGLTFTLFVRAHRWDAL
jgi:hypothetical protein